MTPARPARPTGRWWVSALLIMGTLWWLSSQADTPGPPLPHPLDWAVHFAAYLALAYALARATGRPSVALVAAAWFGALDEVHQAFVPGREAGVQDWLADLAGAWLGIRLALGAVGQTSETSASLGRTREGRQRRATSFDPEGQVGVTAAPGRHA